MFGLLGGLLIGSAGALYLLTNGRIMGASGILGGLLDGSGRGTMAERAAFLVGLILVPWGLAQQFGGGQTHATDNLALLIGAGLLVGAGTRLAGGCTSGHGVCGISRLTLRGLVSTCIYVGFGVLTMAVMRFALGMM